MTNDKALQFHFHCVSIAADGYDTKCFMEQLRAGTRKNNVGILKSAKMV